MIGMGFKKILLMNLVKNSGSGSENLFFSTPTICREFLDIKIIFESGTNI